MGHRPICKKYGSNKSVKNVHNRCGTQRYKCKDCEAVFVWKYQKKSTIAKYRDKRKIMDCYAEGMGANSICRIFKVGINSLQAWIKKEGKEFLQPDITEEAESVDMAMLLQNDKKNTGCSYWK